jgi:predicted O-linked N-acetylglucosamine transferase (SPINDLY family)
MSEARGIFRHALRSYPSHPDILHALGVLEHQAGNNVLALQLIGKALDINAYSPSYSVNYGNVLHALGRNTEALVTFDRVISHTPSDVGALRNRGLVLHALERYKEAYDSFSQALAVTPSSAEILSERAAVLIDDDQAAAALDDLRVSIELKPTLALSHLRRGMAFTVLQQYEKALASYDEVVRLKPNDWEALHNKGHVYHLQRQYKLAITFFDRAIAANPTSFKTHFCRGNSLMELGEHLQACVSFDKAIGVLPQYFEAYCNMAVCLTALKECGAAFEAYKRALSLRPNEPYLRGELVFSALVMCQWSSYDRDIADLELRVLNKEIVVQPFSVCSMTHSPTVIQQAAQRWIETRAPENLSLGQIAKHAPKPRLRIGYYSADFFAHATMFLIAGLLTQHNRQDFEIIAFSYGPSPDDEVRAKAVQSVDTFLDVRDKTDAEVAELSRQMGIDIAVDLKGMTDHTRMNIFSYRAAPIQVSYLGYPGTLGAAYFDYIVADKIVIKPGTEALYTEKIVYLPHTYQVNDQNRIISNVPSSRAHHGLPEDAIVYVCFNNHHKINPETFSSWMRILARVPGSVLWLLKPNNFSIKNLKDEAEARGISRDRLVFAPRCAQGEHLGRHRFADLALDTLPYNAHTTSSDALWSGVPVLTLLGNAFPGRVAASLLTAVGLPELITESRTAYEDLAVSLGQNPAKIQALKDKLARNRLTTPLFDTVLFTRHLESAYQTMWDRYQADQPPEAFTVPDLSNASV